MMALWILLRPFAHWIVGAIGLVTLVGGFAYQQQSIGAKKERVRAVVEGKKIHERAKKKAADAARNPVVLCRDC